MQDYFLLILKNGTKNHSHQLARCAGSWGSSLDPSSFERDIFSCLKLASISFLMMDNGKLSLKEFSTCCNRNKKCNVLQNQAFLCFLWTDNIMWMKIKSNKLTWIADSWCAMYLWLPRCFTSSFTCWLSTSSWFSLPIKEK